MRAAEWSDPGSAAVPSATALAIRSTNLMLGDNKEQLPDIVLVLVESWGLA